MTWTCPAIDHGVTIFPNGKIGPCCQIDSTYLKPISIVHKHDRFADLKTSTPPSACEKCVVAEANNRRSYRQMYELIVQPTPGLQFIDIRHSNLCNLKCRYCGPHFSSRWAEELGIQSQSEIDLKNLMSVLVTDDLHWMYFTGGEPMINADHWALLQQLVESDRAKNIALLYNTNLTTIKYKDINIVDLWENFKSVTIQCSIDAIGEPLEYIRSGTRWDNIHNNLQTLMFRANNRNINITLSPVLSILNLWFLPELLEYARQHQLLVSPIVLTGPDYLALDVVPDELQDLALKKVQQSAEFLAQDTVQHLKQLISNNINQCLFMHTINHVLLLDNNRGEKLFDLLPFGKLAQDKILKNHEYE